MDVKRLTDKELKKESKVYEEMIFKVGCYSVKDCLILSAINKELKRRGLI